ncbi:MAG: hypothetical protein GY756_27630, partial [bacterium]|nr:hypothetical protein [bacterium]
VERNKAVLLTAGEEAVENLIEREFQRVNTIVKQDLSGFPVLQHKLFDQINKIDSDYQNSSELTPDPPEWIEAVEAVSKLKDNRSGLIADVLDRINKTVNDQFKTSMSEYRKAIGTHHTILNKLMPYWRKLTQNLENLGKSINGIHERVVHIDNRMSEYDEIRKKTDKAERILKSSSLTQFFISGFFLILAVGAIAFNYKIISLPMSELVGGGTIYGYNISDMAALIIILIELTVGIYLMDTLRYTRLFPV